MLSSPSFTGLVWLVANIAIITVLELLLVPTVLKKKNTRKDEEEAWEGKLFDKQTCGLCYDLQGTHKYQRILAFHL